MILLGIAIGFLLARLVHPMIDDRAIRVPYLTIFQKTVRRYRDWKNLFEFDYASESDKAITFRDDLYTKIVEMEANQFTTNSDWAEILPICKYADEWFAQTHPYIAEPAKTENLVRKLMA